MIPVDASLAQKIVVELGISVSSIDLLDKGYSFDRKYVVQSDHGTLLLRVSDIADEEKRREEFRAVSRLHLQGILAPEGICFLSRGNRCFGLYRYIDGQSGEDAVPAMSPLEQGAAGWQSGRQLRMIHAAHPSPGRVDEGAIRAPKFRRSRAELMILNQMVEEEIVAAEYVERNLHLAEDRPSVFRHGDFHPANLIFCGSDLAGVIDFNRCDFGDPYDDFYKLALFAAPLSESFASGVIRGYFEGEPTEEFWPLYNFYVAAILASDIMWTHTLYPHQLPDSIARVQGILHTHDFVHRGPPTWFK